MVASMAYSSREPVFAVASGTVLSNAERVAVFSRSRGGWRRLGSRRADGAVTVLTLACLVTSVAIGVGHPVLAITHGAIETLTVGVAYSVVGLTVSGTWSSSGRADRRDGTSGTTVFVAILANRRGLPELAITGRPV